MKTFYVEWEETCARCTGTGVEQHWEWAKYWEETDGYRDLPLKEQQNADNNWWTEQGYTSVDNWPSEEVYCADCDGEGIRTGRVTLAEALAEMQEEQ